MTFTTDTSLFLLPVALPESSSGFKLYERKKCLASVANLYLQIDTLFFNRY
ncbi:hypothetical protein [uncultured Microscilla sp.]|uniref:hypothetical protein n=1 Tax=uncultured Microscilla sp. TaxID=432653 RepID=UPI0026395C42|nr:hypothetical protein [uncultured Microscilla sp.]